jgi:hypothetical protein
VTPEGSVLRSLSYLAERFLDRRIAGMLDQTGTPDDGQLILPEQLWPTTFS